MKIKKIKNKDEYFEDIIKKQQLKIYKYYNYCKLANKELKRLNRLTKKVMILLSKGSSKLSKLKETINE